MGKRLTTEQFIERAIKAHGNKYDYSKVEYINNKTKILIVCPNHGEFEQLPANHLDGHGCKDCYDTSRLKNTEEFIKEATKIHGCTYDYTDSVYNGAKQSITIKCLIHGKFEQRPDVHLSGHGCPECASYGFDKTKSAILYYLKVTTEDNQTLYKIGITNRTVNERFNLTDLLKIEIIKLEKFEVGLDALNKEQEILKKYYKYRYTGPHVLESSGNTELFTEDVLSF